MLFYSTDNLFNVPSLELFRLVSAIIFLPNYGRNSSTWLDLISAPQYVSKHQTYFPKGE